MLLFTSFFSIGQVANFSTDYMENCKWNDSTQKFSDCTGSDDATLFKLNKDKTQFVHYTPSIKSTYFVDSWSYDQPNDVYIYQVTSDIGNKYTFVVDLTSEQIRILGTDSYGKYYMIKHYIKKYWVENQ